MSDVRDSEHRAGASPESWISICEALPESTVPCLAVDPKAGPDGPVFPACRRGMGWYRIGNGRRLEPTHWMPFPAPPAAASEWPAAAQEILGVVPQSTCEAVLLRTIQCLVEVLKDDRKDESTLDAILRKDAQERKINILVHVFTGARSRIYSADHPEVRALVAAIDRLRKEGS